MNPGCWSAPEAQKAARFIPAVARGEIHLAQFERKMGISASTLHRIELAEQNVTIDTLEPSWIA